MSVSRRAGFRHSRLCTNRLTQLEHRILSLYAAGLRRAQISANVGLSEHTISHYLTIAKEKLGASTLVQAAILVLVSTGSHEDQL